jgi:hypothetical protein
MWVAKLVSMAKPRITLPTSAGRSKFQYEGSVRDGTTIYSGRSFQYPIQVTAAQYARMLDKFTGQEVSKGTSRTDPPNGSLGRWLYEEMGFYGMTSYIVPILVAEGFAEPGATSDRVRFKSK